MGLAWFGSGLGCNQSKPAIDAPDTEGKIMCCTLAAVCHDDAMGAGAEGGAAGSTASGAPASPAACHELGHEADPDDCREFYEGCLELCGVTSAAEDTARQGCE